MTNRGKKINIADLDNTYYVIVTRIPMRDGNVKKHIVSVDDWKKIHEIWKTAMRNGKAKNTIIEVRNWDITADMICSVYSSYQH